MSGYMLEVSTDLLNDPGIWKLTEACQWAKWGPEGLRPRFSHLFRLKPIPVDRRRHDRNAIWARFDGVCYLCREPVGADEFHIEHVVPLARGGTDSIENLNIAHGPCNIRKGAKLLAELTWYEA